MWPYQLFLASNACTLRLFGLLYVLYIPPHSTGLETVILRARALSRGKAIENDISITVMSGDDQQCATGKLPGVGVRRNVFRGEQLGECQGFKPGHSKEVRAFMSLTR